jgi:ribosome-binding ATPase
MALKCGIVGLPNVGKSTLFNALTETSKAQAANFPFCTIEPNSGIVNVPDLRLDRLAKLNNSAKTLATTLEFVDIAGLVKGASQGEGLGNKFLANIREVDAIIHVVRCFEDDDITHVSGKIEPLEDIEIIETELMLADLESVTKRITNLEKKIRAKDKEAIIENDLCQRAKKLLEEGKPARNMEVSDDEKKNFQMLQLLTSKKVLFVCNMAEEEVNEENKYVLDVKKYAADNSAQIVKISAKIEEEIAQLADQEEKKEFLETIGLDETGLNKIIKASYELLQLITFFTSGPTETRAWTLDVGSLAPQAAGKIHSDFEKGFICAETISYQDYIEFNGEKAAKENGKMRQEGKQYLVKDGDIILFRHNV